MIEHFHFLRPYWLFLLPAALGLLWFLSVEADPRRQWRQFVAPHLLEVLLVKKRDESVFTPKRLFFGVLILSIFALAGPSWRQQSSPFTQDTASLVVVLKVTPSMLTEDVQPTRLVRAGHKIEDLLERRPGTRTALIAYAGSAHLVMPLTSDASIITAFSRELEPDIMPAQGDTPGPALEMAEQILSEAGEIGSILWIGDELAIEQAREIAQQRKSTQSALVLLGAVVPQSDSPEASGLKRAASELNASLEFISPDDRDVSGIEKSVESAFSSVQDTQEGSVWQDEGYWLLYPIMILGLFWFRPGWVVRF